MKRDMDLVRKILMACEDHAHGRAPITFRLTDIRTSKSATTSTL